MNLHDDLVILDRPSETHAERSLGPVAPAFEPVLQFMSEEQRKAMFARMHGGGGGMSAMRASVSAHTLHAATTMSQRLAAIRSARSASSARRETARGVKANQDMRAAGMHTLSTHKGPGTALARAHVAETHSAIDTHLRSMGHAARGQFLGGGKVDEKAGSRMQRLHEAANAHVERLRQHGDKLIANHVSPNYQSNERLSRSSNALQKQGERFATRNRDAEVTARHADMAQVKLNEMHVRGEITNDQLTEMIHKAGTTRVRAELEGNAAQKGLRETAARHSMTNYAMELRAKYNENSIQGAAVANAKAAVRSHIASMGKAAHAGMDSLHQTAHAGLDKMAAARSKVDLHAAHAQAMGQLHEAHGQAKGALHGARSAASDHLNSAGQHAMSGTIAGHVALDRAHTRMSQAVDRVHAQASKQMDHVAARASHLHDTLGPKVDHAAGVVKAQLPSKQGLSSRVSSARQTAHTVGERAAAAASSPHQVKSDLKAAASGVHAQMAPHIAVARAKIASTVKAAKGVARDAANYGMASHLYETEDVLGNRQGHKMSATHLDTLQKLNPHHPLARMGATHEDLAMAKAAARTGGPSDAAHLRALNMFSPGHYQTRRGGNRVHGTAHVVGSVLRAVAND